MKDTIKKILKSFYQMKTGIILLVVIALLSIIGTVIPQGNPEEFYLHSYSNFWAKLILACDFDKVYSSWWFILLTVLLLINLFLCSVNRFKIIFDKSFNDPELRPRLKNYQSWTRVKDDDLSIFKKLNIRTYKKTEIEGKDVYYAFDGKIGHMGSWLTHLSLIIIILAFAYGWYQGFEEFIHGVPGTVMELTNSDYKIKVDQYDVMFREDYTVEQYITSLSILDKDNKEVDKGVAMVNKPFRFKDFNVYQNSTGWAYDALLFKGEKLFEDRLMYKGDVFVADDKKIALQFVDFYPDFDEESMMKPRTKSPFLNHPVSLYALYYDGIRVDMGLNHPGDPIKWEDYTFVIRDPQMFTLVQVARDPATPIALLGAALLMLGLFLAFYVNPREVILVREEECDYLHIRQAKHDKLHSKKYEKIIGEIKL